MSEFASARTADLSAALAALTAELDDRPIDGGDYDHITPILSHLTIGHLRQIAAALAAPYVPGYVAVDDEGDEAINWGDREFFTLARYEFGDVRAKSRTYFVAVQS